MVVPMPFLEGIMSISNRPMPFSAVDGELLRVEDLRVYFGHHKAPVRAVDGVSLAVRRGESVGLVGESGCGKTTVGRAVMKLVEIIEGRILFGGYDITSLRGGNLREYRKQAQMVFQDPYGSLNARMPVGQAIEEVLHVHKRGDRAQRRKQASELFHAVGLNPEYLGRYPHEFSGGQRQRIGIARALAVGPSLIIADEPVSALDVSVQIQILNLLRDLQRNMGLSYLFVAHDLSVVRYMCDRIMVMYLGKIVESGSSERIYSFPSHPYTEALLSSVPDVGKGLDSRKGGSKRIVLKGDMPSPTRQIPGCPFHTRCHRARDKCRVDAPRLRRVHPYQWSACHYAEELLEENRTASGTSKSDAF